jgi:hypothetical protein
MKVKKSKTSQAPKKYNMQDYFQNTIYKKDIKENISIFYRESQMEYAISK